MNGSTNKQIEWGLEPEFLGPKHLFREYHIIKKIKKYAKTGQILDAGFGSGSLLLKLSKLKFDVKGIEVSDKSINYVKSKIKNKDNIIIKKGDITKIPFKNNQFDSVVCTEVLEHVKKDEIAIKEFRRVLKDSGKCIISVPINKKKWDFTDEIAGHFRRYEPKELIKLFTDNGFKILKIKKFGFLLLEIYHKYIYSKAVSKRKKLKFTNPFINLSSKALLYFFIIFDPIFKNKSPLNIILVAEKLPSPCIK